MTRQEEKKQNAINTTVVLCSQYGFHGTSMDQITAATGLSKATIYKYFVSKENLIACALEVYSQMAIERLGTLLNDTSKTLNDRLSTRFNGLRAGIDLGQFHGCYFQLAYTEYCNTDSRISAICTHYKSSMISLVEQCLKSQNVKGAAQKAIKAEMIFNGLLSTLHLSREPVLIDMAETMYMDIISA